MKSLALLLGVMLVAHPGWGQGRGTPVPRGVRDGEQADAQAQQSIPPPLQRSPTADPAKLQRDAQELADLAASVPPAIKQANKGMLPNDLPEKLKRIEKLAKRLRNELNP